MNTNKWKLARRLLLVPGCAMLGVSTVVAQATTQVDPATLARYDLNNNGVLDASELSALQADQARAGQTPVTSGSTTGQQSVVELSPFQVDASGDIGYYAENTLAGTRLNTNVGDLAASITVVTRQQLDDTGAIDINDIFMYEANTEGAHSYTPHNLNRSVIRDNIGGYSSDEGDPMSSATANRVRGLGSVNTAQNNHPTLSRLAFDAYNTNTVEINRGPNSMLFGTGSASGIINQSTSEAVIGQRRTSVSGRIGSNDAWRASISTNIPLGDHLAIYVAGLYDERGYSRKPSYDIYRRQYGALTFQPFRTTKITASFENYDNRNSRPNAIAPLDFVTPWLEAGRPGWNPVTQMVTIMDTGQVRGPYLESTLDPRWTGPNTTVFPVGGGALTTTTSPMYIPGITFGTRNQLFIDQGQIVNFTVGQLTVGGTAANGLPANADRTAQDWLIAGARLTQSSQFALPIPDPSTGATHWGSNMWYRTGITNKSIYDWEKYNAQGANHGSQKAKSWNVELQQQILPNLNLSAGWLRQEMYEATHYGLGQANNAVQIMVDTNTHNLDGTPNPYFGTPFVTDWQADTFERPEINDSRRAVLAYSLDFTQNDGWTRHLGMHRFFGLASSQLRETENLRYRFSFNGGESRFLPAAAFDPAWTGNWASGASIERKYYLGQNPNGQVERGATTVGEHGFSGGPGHATMLFFDWTNRLHRVAEMSFQPNLFYAGGRYGLTRNEIDATNLGWQGYLWNNRIIPTMGWRKDKLKIRQYNANASTNAEKYTAGFGNLGPHRLLGPVNDVEGSTSTRGVVARPFRGWGNIDRRAENGSLLADFVRGLSFHYNESDNFNAPTSIRQDFFGNEIGKPSGKGKDWGIGGSMFNNKLSFKVNWYESTNVLASANAANTAITRAIRIDDGVRAWATQVVRVRNGEDPTDANFNNNTVNPLTPAMAAQIKALWGLPFTLDEAWPSNPSGAQVTGTESNLSKGMEVQLIYNPIRNWNMKFTFGKQEAFYSDAIGELSRWLAHRKPQWEAMSAPELTQVFIRSNGNHLYLQNPWNGYGFNADAPSNNQGQTGSLRATYSSIVESQLFQLTALQGASSPSLRKYNASFITNYSFQRGRLNGFAVGGNLRWADKATGGYYAELDPANYARPLPDPNERAEIVRPDLNRPIYVSAETHVDVWASYTRRILNDRVRMKLQLNVRDALKGTFLQTVLFQGDGSPAQYRIRDGRNWMLTSTFDF